jgi:hypothetical protein
MLRGLPGHKQHFATFSGVGKSTAARLVGSLAIERGADLKSLGEERLRALLGKHRHQLYHIVSGKDDRPVEPMRAQSAGQARDH